MLSEAGRSPLVPDDLSAYVGHANGYVLVFSNGLRVYLDRPWWSSGAGELLGVVVLQRAQRDRLRLARRAELREVAVGVVAGPGQRRRGSI